MPTTSIHGKCLDAVHSLCQTNATAIGIASARIYKYKLVDDTSVTLPALICSHQGVEVVAGDTNSNEKWGYPVQLCIIAAENQDLTFEDTYLDSRRVIRNLFHNKAAIITDVSQCYACSFEPGPIIEEVAFYDLNCFASFMTIRCWCRESRS